MVEKERQTDPMDELVSARAGEGQPDSRRQPERRPEAPLVSVALALGFCSRRGLPRATTGAEVNDLRTPRVDKPPPDAEQVLQQTQVVVDRLGGTRVSDHEASS